MSDREKLVELLEGCRRCDTIADIADHLIAHGVVISKMEITTQKWIPVTERLPDKDCYCLIYTTVYFTPDHYDEPDHYNSVEKSYYSTEIGFMGTHGIYAKAWMPLPEPPKED